MKSLLVVLSLCSYALGRPDVVIQEPLHEGWHLIKTSEESPAFWIDPETLSSLPEQDVKFMDITYTQDTPIFAESVRKSTEQIVYPDVPVQQEQVELISRQLNVTSLQSFMQSFTSFHTRYHTSQSGQDSALWIRQQCESIIASSGRNDISVRTMSFNGSPQPNVIARIEGSGSARDMVIIGAHQDSVNSQGAGTPATRRSPGADDDGSGSMTTLEVFRAVVAGGFTPDRPLEFQWYAAEEVGLVGSAALANEYARTGQQVHAMMQLDMDGYAPTNPRIFLITDFTDNSLTAFVRKLVDEYLSISWQNDVCGYACSDHASFFRAGFPASYPFESTFNNAIHTINDDLSRINYNYMMNFAQLEVAYLVELGLLS